MWKLNADLLILVRLSTIFWIDMLNLIVGGIYYVAELKAGTKVTCLYLTASLVQYLFRPPYLSAT
jgi:hypothetical protein